VIRVLLITSHPLAPPWDSADKQIAVSLVSHLDDTNFITFGRWSRATPWRQIPILSRHGRPGLLERVQVALLAAALQPAVSLTHVVTTIGEGYGAFSRRYASLPAPFRRPTIHTVPGVLDPSFLVGAKPLGVTVALSQATAELLQSAGFRDLRVILPGIPLARWPVTPRPREVPETVLFAGHHDPGGGADDAILGAARARRGGRRLRLVLAMRTRLGQDERVESERLASLASDAGVNVEVLGHVADMRALIRRASVVLFPGTRLAGKADLPLVLLEAMATGRPVVASDLPQLAALQDGIVRIPPGSAPRLGAALGQLLDDGAAWKRQAAIGRRVVEQRFSDVAMAAAYGQLYREMVDTSRA
jgi:glycosyltransferase involved in cell wall biosynthesis